MSRKTSAVVGGQTGRAVQYNFLRDEARGASWLLAYGTSTLKVQINAGLAYFKEGLVEFAGGLSPVLTEPTASSRIDVVSMASSAEIVITVGVEADTPSAPSAPADNIAICEVYNKAGQVEITDEDEDAGEGYISKDLRVFLRLPKHASLTEKGISEEATAAEINAGTQEGGTGAQLIVNPKYLKDSEYYTRRPTADEKAALAGTGAPSAANKYVTNDDTSNSSVANKVVRYTAGGDVNVPTTPGAAQDAASKAYVDGKGIKNVAFGNFVATGATAGQVINCVVGFTPKVFILIWKKASRDNFSGQGVAKGVGDEECVYSNGPDYGDGNSSTKIYVAKDSVDNNSSGDVTAFGTTVTITMTSDPTWVGPADVHCMWIALL